MIVHWWDDHERYIIYYECLFKRLSIHPPKSCILDLAYCNGCFKCAKKNIFWIVLMVVKAAVWHFFTRLFRYFLEYLSCFRERIHCQTPFQVLYERKSSRHLLVPGRLQTAVINTELNPWPWIWKHDLLTDKKKMSVKLLLRQLLHIFQNHLFIRVQNAKHLLVLASQMWVFAACKLNIFGVWTVGQTKQGKTSNFYCTIIIDHLSGPTNVFVVWYQ